MLELSFTEKYPIVFSEIDSKLLEKISRRILSALPTANPKLLLNTVEITTIAGIYSTTEESVIDLISYLIRLWKYVVFHQLKIEILQDFLITVGVPSSSIDVIISLWTSEGPNVVCRLARITASGIPRVQNVSWNIQIKLASDAIPSMKQPVLRLNIFTDQGSKIILLSAPEAIALYQTTNIIQESLDNLLQ